MAETPATDYEFDPQKEITPMAGRFFSDVENDSKLSRSAKTRIQSGYLDSVEQIDAQRRKLEDERMRNLLDRQRLEEGNMALSEMRRRQDEVARSAEVQKTLSGEVKRILDSNLPLIEQRKQIDNLKLSNPGAVHDPQTRSIFEVADSNLTLPEPLLSRADVKGLILDKNVPAEIAEMAQNNPELARRWIEMDEIRKKGESKNEEEVKEALKQRTDMVMNVAKEPPKFISEKDLPDTVSMEDPNRLKYLTPESQQRGRDLMLTAYGPKKVAEYNSLPSDADRYEAILEARSEVLLRLVGDLQKPAKEKTVDNTVDSLLFGTKKR